MKTQLLVAAFSVLFASNSFANTALQKHMASQAYKNDVKTNQHLLNGFNYLDFSKKFDNFNNYRRPYEQEASIKSAQLWKSWVKNYCASITDGAYKALRDNINTNVVAEGEVLIKFNNEFQHASIKRLCQDTVKFEQQAIKGEKNSGLVDSINSGFKYYSEQLKRASKSNLFLAKVYSQANGSTFKTVRSSKQSLETLITVHEILANDKKSKQWRSDFKRLNRQFDETKLQKAARISQKFKEPRALYKKDDSAVFQKKISSLLAEKYKNKINSIILWDNDFRDFNNLQSQNKSKNFSAISFYVVTQKQKNIELIFGWYQIEKLTGADKVIIVSSEVI